LAVRHLSWRLLDQSKNAILPTPPAFGGDPIRIEVFGIRKLESLGYCVALFAWFYVQPFARTQLVTDRWKDIGPQLIPK